MCAAHIDADFRIGDINAVQTHGHADLTDDAGEVLCSIFNVAAADGAAAQAMRNVIQMASCLSDCVSHIAVGFGEGHACQVGSPSQLLPSLIVLGMGACDGQPLGDQTDGLICEQITVMGITDVAQGFHCVCKRIQTTPCGHTSRGTNLQLRVNDAVGRGRRQTDLGAGSVVVDNGHEGGFRTGTSSGGNADSFQQGLFIILLEGQIQIEVGQNFFRIIVGQNGNDLCAVHAGAAADAQCAVSAEFASDLSAFQQVGSGALAAGVVPYQALNTLFLQGSFDLCGETQCVDAFVGDNHDLLAAHLSRDIACLVDGTLAKEDRC